MPEAILVADDEPGVRESLGEVLRTRCRGWSACVFTGNARLARYLDMPATEEVALFNGKIPCRLLKYKLE